MTTTPLRFGLIGTGRIGQVHAANIAADPDAELAWICDPFVDGAHALSTRLGGRVTEDAAEMMASGGVDAVLIASPTPTHVDLIAAAIDHGLPVLCEKPIDLDIARVDALLPRVQSSGVPVALGSTAASTRRSRRRAPAWPRARSARSSSCRSSAATRPRRPPRTSRSRAGSSAT